MSFLKRFMITCRRNRLANNGAHAGSLVGLVAVGGVAVCVVDTNQDARVVGSVSSRDLLGFCWGERATASNFDLGTAAVELSLANNTGTVKTEQLNAEKILARSNATGHGEVVPSVSRDYIIDPPDASGSVKVVLGNLEPFGALVGGRGGVVDLGEPVGDRTLVRRGDGVVGMVFAVDVGPPVATNLGTSGDSEDGIVSGARLAAGHVRRVDVLNRVIGAWSTETGELPHILAIHGDSLENYLSTQ